MKKQTLMTSFINQSKSGHSAQQSADSFAQENTELPLSNGIKAKVPTSQFEEKSEVNYSTSAPVDISLNMDESPVQPILKHYPKKQISNRNRSFKFSWYNQFPLLEYSKIRDEIFCFVCRHFLTNSASTFITGYSNWKNASKDLHKHFNSEGSQHHSAVQKYVSYKNTRVSGSVVTQLDSHLKNQVIRNRNVISTYVEILLFCARQEIALRGHREGENSNNKGNFLELIELVKRKCPEISTQISQMPGNAQYQNKSIQNELIGVSRSLIVKKIVEEISEGKMYSLMVDESKDNSGTEQLSVCVRYVHQSNVMERFLGFADLDQFDAMALTDKTVKLLTESGLRICDCVAQSYDGASVMSGDISGVHARFEEKVGGYCPYVHCYAHRLNLVLVDCCTSISQVRDLLGLLESIYVFQSNSAKRANYFIKAQELIQQEVLKLPQSCATRWYSKKKGLSFFRNRYKAVIIALEEITDNGKPDEVAQCKGYLNQLCSFETIVILVVLDEVLGQTQALSEYLQFSELMYTRAVSLCQATVKSLQEMRAEEKFRTFWYDATNLSNSVFVTVPTEDEIVPQKRRKIASRRLQDSFVTTTTGSRTTEVTTRYENLRRIYFEIIDKFVEEMKWRLLSKDKLFSLLEATDPTSENFLNKELVLQFYDRFSRYNIQKDAITSQLHVAKNLILAENINKTRGCLEFLLPMKTGFHELLMYLRLALTIPVSSVSCERSFSALNRIKSYMRSSMKEDRINGLALLSIEKDMTSELYQNSLRVVDEFAKNEHRRFSFSL